MNINTEIFKELPDEIQNHIYKYISPHPNAVSLKIHIHHLKLTDCETDWRMGNTYFNDAFFNFRKNALNKYKINLYKYNEEIKFNLEKLRFIKYEMLNTSTSHSEALQTWNLQTWGNDLW